MIFFASSTDLRTQRKSIEVSTYKETLLFNERMCMYRGEEGSVILLTLVMLILLTLLGIAATTTTIIETQISGNDRLYKQNLMEADSGVSWAIARLNQGDATVSDGSEFARLKPYPGNFKVIKLHDNLGPPVSVDILSESTTGNGKATIWAGIALPTPIRGALPDSGDPNTY